MNNPINDGGPAYPVRDMTMRGNAGMSLRAYAAIHMGGFEADTTVAFATVFNSDTHPDEGDYLAWALWWAKANARFRCIHADAMIAALGENRAIRAPLSGPISVGDKFMFHPDAAHVQPRLIEVTHNSGMHVSAKDLDGTELVWREDNFRAAHTRGEAQ